MQRSTPLGGADRCGRPKQESLSPHLGKSRTRELRERSSSRSEEISHDVRLAARRPTPHPGVRRHLPFRFPAFCAIFKIKHQAASRELLACREAANRAPAASCSLATVVSPLLPKEVDATRTRKKDTPGA